MIPAGLHQIFSIPAFRDALTRLNKGQMSAPVHSSFGWHLIELLDTRNVDKTDAAQKDRAYRMLMNRASSRKKQQAGCRNNVPAPTLNPEQLMVKTQRVVIQLPASPPGLART